MFNLWRWERSWQCPVLSLKVVTWAALSSWWMVDAVLFRDMHNHRHVAVTDHGVRDDYIRWPWVTTDDDDDADDDDENDDGEENETNAQKHRANPVYQDLSVGERNGLTFANFAFSLSLSYSLPLTHTSTHTPQTHSQHTHKRLYIHKHPHTHTNITLIPIHTCWRQCWDSNTFDSHPLCSLTREWNGPADEMLGWSPHRWWSPQSGSRWESDWWTPDVWAAVMCPHRTSAHGQRLQSICLFISTKRK